MTSDAPRCHDCGNHEKCEAQRRAEAELAEARMENERLRSLMEGRETMTSPKNPEPTPKPDRPPEGESGISPSEDGSR